MNVDRQTLAVQCATRGWRVFPIGRGTKKPVAGFSWPTAATCDPKEIESWWETYDDPNFAVVTGESSGLLVVDLDRKVGPDGELEDGCQTLRALEVEHGGLPSTLTVQTPSGGVHLYFEYDGDDAGSSTRKLGPGIDIKANGGYVVGPGSRIGQNTYTIVKGWRA